MPRASRRTGLAFAVLVLLAGSSSARAEWVDWIVDANLAFQYTDNLNFSATNWNEMHDSSWHSMAAVGRVYQLTDRTRVNLTGEVSGEVHHHFDDLDSIEGGGRLSIVHKLGLGNAPWIRASLFGGYKDVSESDRSGRRFEVGAAVGKRFSPRFDASLDYRWTDRNGGDGPVANPLVSTDVFDQKFHVITATGNFLLTEDLLVTAGYAFRFGDFDSTCSPGMVGKVLATEDVKAMALDQVFGSCIYRLEGTAHSAFVNFSYGLSDRFSLDAGYRFLYGKADHLDYSTNTVQAAVVFRY